MLPPATLEATFFGRKLAQVRGVHAAIGLVGICRRKMQGAKSFGTFDVRLACFRKTLNRRRVGFHDDRKSEKPESEIKSASAIHGSGMVFVF